VAEALLLLIRPVAYWCSNPTTRTAVASAWPSSAGHVVCVSHCTTATPLRKGCKGCLLFCHVTRPALALTCPWEGMQCPWKACPWEGMLGCGICLVAAVLKTCRWAHLTLARSCAGVPGALRLPRARQHPGLADEHRGRKPAAPLRRLPGHQA